MTARFAYAKIFLGTCRHKTRFTILYRTGGAFIIDKETWETMDEDEQRRAVYELLERQMKTQFRIDNSLMHLRVMLFLLILIPIIMTVLGILLQT